MDTITTIQDLLKFNGSAQSVTVNLTESTERLIAAAPELLEALKIVSNFDWRNNRTHMLEIVNTALAKAEGR